MTRPRIAPRIALLAVLLAAVFVLAACAAGPNDAAGVGTPEPAGFWLGLWHGFIVPVTFVISLFTDNVSVYEVHNNGNWYDFGFALGAMMILGGSHTGRSRRR